MYLVSASADGQPGAGYLPVSQLVTLCQVIITIVIIIKGENLTTGEGADKSNDGCVATDTKSVLSLTT